MQKMNLCHTTFRMGSGMAELASGLRLPLAGLGLRRLAVCAALLHGLSSGQAADPVSAAQPDSTPAKAQQVAYTPQGRQMKRYQAFARQAQLPAMRTTDTLLEVGDAVKTDISRLAELSATDKQALARQFAVPVGVVDQLALHSGAASRAGADRFAQELRTAVIDYRFLRIEWDRYHPPAEGQQVKATALAALQSGELTKAWELYDGLRKPEPPAIAAPAPPANLRIVTTP